MYPLARRSLPRLALVLVAGLASFEASLQVVAYVKWRRQLRAPAERPAGVAHVVLCVGDSFTYGIGSKAGDGYPEIAQHLLRDRDRRDVAVVNGAWPGRSSREVLEQLAGQLVRYRPDLVYAMIGLGDEANRPQPLPAGAENEVRHTAFPLRWQSARLLRLRLAQDQRAPVAAGGVPRFVGVWHGVPHGEEVVFTPDGRLAAGGLNLRWELRGGRLKVLVPDGRELDVDWRLAGDRLTLTCPLWPEQQVLARGPSSGADGALKAAERDLDAGRLQRAVAGFRTCAGVPELEPAARAGLVRALADSDRDAALAELDQLRQLARRQPEKASDSLARAFAALGLHDELIELCCREIRSRGTTQWGLLLGSLRERDHRDRIDAALRETFRTRRDLPAARRADLARALSMLAELRGDATDNLRWLLRATRLDGATGPLLQVVRQRRDHLPRSTLTALLDDIGFDAATRERLDDLIAEAYGERSRAEQVLLDHLRRLVALCRRHGAVAILLDYPCAAPMAQRVLDQLRGEAEVVDVRDVFVHELESRDAGELFALPDKHCTDGGYRLLARIVAGDVERRLQN